MNTATSSIEPFVAGRAAPTRSASALHSLMQMWEQETCVEEDEGEAELMVMLSGMVGSHAMSVEDQ